jgi:hypothetical protein
MTASFAPRGVERERRPAEERLALEASNLVEVRHVRPAMESSEREIHGWP